MNPIRKIGRTLKARYYRAALGLKHTDKTVYFGGKSNISRDLEAEPYVYIGSGCTIYPKVHIGAYTMLANNVSIVGADHNYRKAGSPIIFSGRDQLHDTRIGRDCWLGMNSIIMCGTTIGDGSIIAAGSVVTHDVEPYSIYGGVPARKLRDRFLTPEETARHKAMLEGGIIEVTDDMLCADVK